MAQRGETPFSFNSGVLSQMPIGIRSQLAHVIMDTCYRLDPFRTPHVRGFFGPRTQERDHLINRSQCLNYAYAHAVPFGSPSEPRPMGVGNVRFTYSLANMHYIRNLSCTRRILLTGSNYKLIRDLQVSPSMTVETASLPLVPATSYRIQVHNAKKKICRLEYRNREDLNELV